jgi:hypothetical protein
MTIPPPAYAEADGQMTHPWPTPTAHPTSTSCWMREDALKILQTGHDFNAIRLICRFVPTLGFAIAATLLSKRRESWLVAFLKTLCRDEALQEPPCDSPLSTAEAIVSIIRRRRVSPAPEWNGAGFFSALNSSTDISIIAKKLYDQTSTTFSAITFEDWQAWYCGLPNDPIQSLLNAAFNFRNDLARSVQKGGIAVDQLVSLQKASLYSCVKL